MKKLLLGAALTLGASTMLPALAHADACNGGLSVCLQDTSYRKFQHAEGKKSFSAENIQGYEAIIAFKARPTVDGFAKLYENFLKAGGGQELNYGGDKASVLRERFATYLKQLKTKARKPESEDITKDLDTVLFAVVTNMQDVHSRIAKTEEYAKWMEGKVYKALAAKIEKANEAKKLLNEKKALEDKKREETYKKLVAAFTQQANDALRRGKGAQKLVDEGKLPSEKSKLDALANGLTAALGRAKESKEALVKMKLDGLNGRKEFKAASAVLADAIEVIGKVRKVLPKGN